MPDGRLPHNVAVCITKFDELRMAETARRFRMIDYDERGVPRVPDSEAREFVVRLCGQFPSRDPELILSKLERAFHPDPGQVLRHVGDRLLRGPAHGQV